MLRASVFQSQLATERLWSWPLVWASALTRPAVVTYAEILAQPQATAQSAYGWLVVCGATSGVLMALATTLRTLGQPGDRGLLLAVPLYTLLALGSWVIFAGCTQWFAKRLHGQGTYPELIYTFATFSAPLSIISTLLAFLPNHGLTTLCLYGYWFLLYVLAIQAVHRFSWRRAISVLLLALASLALLMICLLVGLGYLLL